jgi:hypothetical protein
MSNRGKGFAARLIDDCLSVASAQGVSLVLISGDRGLYRRMGFMDTGLFSVIRLERDNRPPRFHTGCGNGLKLTCRNWRLCTDRRGSDSCVPPERWPPSCGRVRCTAGPPGHG